MFRETECQTHSVAVEMVTKTRIHEDGIRQPQEDLETNRNVDGERWVGSRMLPVSDKGDGRNGSMWKLATKVVEADKLQRCGQSQD